ncbi:MAG TPA: hypothetical protein VE505_09650, partial [Vicinamibacterales bacterium]|nr:hypothetical protein [Vicinamibacterales bacterium]
MVRAESGPLIGALVAAMLVTCTVAARPDDDLQRVTVTDLHGRAVRPFASGPDAAKALVLVFMRSDCPISNRYAPELERLQRQAAAAAIEFWMV